MLRLKNSTTRYPGSYIVFDCHRDGEEITTRGPSAGMHSYLRIYKRRARRWAREFMQLCAAP